MKNILTTLTIGIFLGCASQGMRTSEMISHMKIMQDKNLPFMITNYGAYGPNSVGGFDIFATVQLTTNKPIKYVDITFTTYNKVQDKVFCSVRNRDSFTGRATGPYTWDDKVQIFDFPNSIYNNSTHCAEIDEILVTYMDDEKKTFSNDDLNKLFAPSKFRLNNWKYACNWDNK